MVSKEERQIRFSRLERNADSRMHLGIKINLAVEEETKKMMRCFLHLQQKASKAQNSDTTELWVKAATTFC